jgi:hypothetical protein
MCIYIHIYIYTYTYIYILDAHCIQKRKLGFAVIYNSLLLLKNKSYVVAVDNKYLHIFTGSKHPLVGNCVLCCRCRRRCCMLLSLLLLLPSLLSSLLLLSLSLHVTTSRAQISCRVFLRCVLHHLLLLIYCRGMPISNCCFGHQFYTSVLL